MVQQAVLTRSNTNDRREIEAEVQRTVQPSMREQFLDTLDSLITNQDTRTAFRWARSQLDNWNSMTIQQQAMAIAGGATGAVLGGFPGMAAGFAAGHQLTPAIEAIGGASQQVHDAIVPHNYNFELEGLTASDFDYTPSAITQSTTNNASQMEQVTNEAAQQQEARAGISNIAKETPITVPSTISYGLQDTHTTIIPANVWLSIPNLNNSSPVTLKLRLNAPIDILYNSVINTAASPLTSNSLWVRRCHDVTYPAAGVTPVPASSEFPYTYNGTNMNMWWRNYWAKMYKFYTVLGCEYEINIFNPRTGGRHAIAAYTIETTGVTGANQIPDNARLRDVYGLKNVKYTQIGCRDNANIHPYAKISGQYTPGQQKHDVQNDGDVKTFMKN